MTEPTSAPQNSAASEPPPEVLDEFRRLFNAARKEHSAAGWNATTTSPAHVAAVRYAREQSIPGGVELLDTIVLSRLKRAEDAWRLVEHLLGVVPFGLRGQIHHVRGVALWRLKQHDEAIREFDNALATPGYDTPGTTLNGIGAVYSIQKQYDRAIGLFNEQLTLTPEDNRLRLELGTTVSAPRMILLVNRAEKLAIDVRVDLRGHDTGMT